LVDLPRHNLWLLGFGISNNPKEVLLVSIDQYQRNSLTVEYRAKIILNCLLEVPHAGGAENLLDKTEYGIFIFHFNSVLFH